jgi:hypothetical protein
MARVVREHDANEPHRRLARRGASRIRPALRELVEALGESAGS